MPHKFFVQLSTKQSGDTMRCNTNNLCHPKQILSTTRQRGTSQAWHSQGVSHLLLSTWRQCWHFRLPSVAFWTVSVGVTMGTAMWSALLLTTKLTHQLHREVSVCHGLHLLGTAHLTVQDEGICCCNVQEVQQHGLVPASTSFSVGGVVLDELVWRVSPTHIFVCRPWLAVRRATSLRLHPSPFSALSQLKMQDRWWSRQTPPTTIHFTKTSGHRSSYTFSGDILLCSPCRCHMLQTSSWPGPWTVWD